MNTSANKDNLFMTTFVTVLDLVNIFHDAKIQIFPENKRICYIFLRKI